MLSENRVIGAITIVLTLGNNQMNIKYDAMSYKEIDFYSPTIELTDMEIHGNIIIYHETLREGEYPNYKYTKLKPVAMVRQIDGTYTIIGA